MASQRIPAGSFLEGRVLISTKELSNLNSGTLGFVPTMGALHEGHVSLIEESVRQCDTTVVSIFVNPTQFGVGEDFDRYPRTLEADIITARAAGANYIYAPTIKEVYPDYPEPTLEKNSDPGLLAQNWEGKSRPGHFEGVVSVVKRLFDLIQPERAYFGEKDFQQLRIIEDMTVKMQLPVRIVRCPSVRDSDGLALSSRNRYLSAKDRESALSIYSALRVMQETILQKKKTDVEVLLDLAQSRLSRNIDLDYLALVEEQTLEPVQWLDCDNELQLRAIFAGKVGSIRLIDNIMLVTS
ncbi:MAG: pantoate--beta-alanine ligase [Coriobacteriia bacterium]|nr:pantoate--beta-alanine ligase [Coriobacteriia bacterium]MCL2871071.1 pantoate--beta-alanine ligase [Coriobacteriia bacterium]